MTPALNCLKKQKISHKIYKYQHEPTTQAYGLEAVEKLNIDQELVFKTLVVMLDNHELAVAIIPVAQKLSFKRIAKALGAKKSSMADKDSVVRSSGYVLGGVSPLGQKKALRTVIDLSAQTLAIMLVSAGKRGLEIELAPTDLARLTRANFAEICL
ncbi:MAG: Cys-tRNA(Pro) deacylase [Oceanospirillaceae bacterium]|nr:Cys-tRNA(Pro) deacylase [Oceanospirillaceae bacterium]